MSLLDRKYSRHGFNAFFSLDTTNVYFPPKLSSLHDNTLECHIESNERNFNFFHPRNDSVQATMLVVASVNNKFFVFIQAFSSDISILWRRSLFIERIISPKKMKFHFTNIMQSKDILWTTQCTKENLKRWKSFRYTSKNPTWVEIEHTKKCICN